jgi:hypothetical protein
MELVNRLAGRGHIIYLTLLILLTSSGAYYLGFHNAATTTQLCQAINGNRHRQVILWEYLITAFPPAHETAAARRQRLRADATLMVTVDRIFAPSGCPQP